MMDMMRALGTPGARRVFKSSVFLLKALTFISIIRSPEDNADILSIISRHYLNLSCGV